MQIGIAKENELFFELPSEHPDANKKVAAWYFWLFPNLMVNVYPWGISLNIIQPQSVYKTIVKYITIVLNKDVQLQGAGADLETVEMEDQEVVLRVQRGIQSRIYSRGRYSPTKEQGVHWFHTLLTQR